MRRFGRALAQAAVQPRFSRRAGQRRAGSVSGNGDRHPAIVRGAWSVALAAIAASLLSRRQWWSARRRACPDLLAAGADPRSGNADMGNLGRAAEPMHGRAAGGSARLPRRHARVHLPVRRLVVGPHDPRRPFTPNLPQHAGLCRQVDVYRRAVSPFNHTMQSLPRFVFQTDRSSSSAAAAPSSSTAHGELPTADCPWLFAAARHGRLRDLSARLVPSVSARDGRSGRLLPQLHLRRRGLAGAASPTNCWRTRRSWSDPLSRGWAACSSIIYDLTTYYRMMCRYRHDTLGCTGVSGAKCRAASRAGATRSLCVRARRRLSSAEPASATWTATCGS